MACSTVMRLPSILEKQNIGGTSSVVWKFASFVQLVPRVSNATNFISTALLVIVFMLPLLCFKW